MLSQPKSVKFEVNPGQEIFIETGKLARQADGAVCRRRQEIPGRSRRQERT